MLSSITLSVSIAKDWKDLYEAIWQPHFFTRWASGLAHSTLEAEDDQGASLGASFGASHGDFSGWWKAEGPEGCVRIKFTPHNEFGVMDHQIDVAGRIVCAHMRVLPNEDGAEVIFTLFRLPEMDDAKFKADADWVLRDLQALKKLIEV